MRLRQAMLSSTLQQNATLLLFFATGIVIAHLLTPREAGSYSVALAMVNAIAHLKDTSVVSYAVSAAELDDGLLRSAFGLSLTIAACLALGFFGLSFIIADLYRDSALGESLRIVAVGQFIPAIAFPATIRLMRAMRFDLLLAVGLAAGLTQSVVSIALAALGHGAAGLAWGYFASTVVTALVSIAYRPDTIGLRPMLAGSRRLLSFGSWTSGTYLVGSMAMAAPELLIGRILNLANAALFSRAQNLVSFVRNGLYGGLTRPLLPSLGEREGSGTSIAPIYLRIVETITGLAWPAYAVLAVWAEPLVRAVYGEAWSVAGALMTPVAIAHALTLMVAPHYELLIVKRRQRLLFACEFSVCVVTIIALVIGLTLGLAGAVWSLVLSSAYFAVCYFIAIKSVIGFSGRVLFKAWCRSFMLTVAVIPAPLAVRHLVAGDPFDVIAGFAISGAIAAVIWIAAVMLTRHELSIHITDLLNRIVPPKHLAALPGSLLQLNKTDHA